MTRFDATSPPAAGKAPPWVEMGLLYKRDDPPVERARRRLSRVFGMLDIGEAEVDFTLPEGAAPPFLAQWNPETRNAAYYAGMTAEVRIGAMAHELCHALRNPRPGPEPVDRQSEGYRQEDRIAHRVGDAVSTLLGFPEYGRAAAQHRYANWVPADAMTAEDASEADHVVGQIQALIAAVSVWPLPAAAVHICTDACDGNVHAQPIVVDERDFDRALRWVSLVAEEAGLEVEGLEKVLDQPTPAVTVWMLRYKSR